MPVITAYQPDITIELYCRRTKIGIGLGTSVAFVSIMILCELLYVEDYEKEVLLQSEMLFSVASSVALCWGALVITGQRGSAATVGNLFYSIWLSFVISCTIVCSCLADLEERTFKKKMTQRINSRATNTWENTTLFFVFPTFNNCQWVNEFASHIIVCFSWCISKMKKKSNCCTCVRDTTSPWCFYSIPELLPIKNVRRSQFSIILRRRKYYISIYFTILSNFINLLLLLIFGLFMLSPPFFLPRRLPRTLRN